MNPVRIARLVAIAAGALDFLTGIGLVLAPTLVLPLMRVEIPSSEALVYLRFVGAFVGAVGASYLWAVLRGGTRRLRAVLEFTIVFRLAAGTYTAAAVALGHLSLAWASVPATDFALVVAQLWLLSKIPIADDTPLASFPPQS